MGLEILCKFIFVCVWGGGGALVGHTFHTFISRRPIIHMHVYLTYKSTKLDDKKVYVCMKVLKLYRPFELRHEKTCLYHIRTRNKGAHLPAHLHSLISAFVVRCLDSIIPIILYPKFEDTS